MIRTILKWGALLVIGILVYNYFLGSPEEKQQSKDVFKQIGSLGKTALGLLKSEKAKLEQGKFDGALDKVENLYGDMREKAKAANDSGLLRKLADLERRRAALETSIEQQQSENGGKLGNTPEDQQIKNDWKQLLSDTEKIVNEMEGSAPY